MHTVTGTAGKVSDVTQAHALLHGDDVAAMGDAGDQKGEKREENLGKNVTWHVAMKRSKRKVLPNNKLGRMTEKLEHLNASVRAKVEHPFHVVKYLFRHRKARYRGLAKNTAQLFTLFGFANLVLAGRQFRVADTRASVLRTRTTNAPSRPRGPTSAGNGDEPTAVSDAARHDGTVHKSTAPGRRHPAFTLALRNTLRRRSRFLLTTLLLSSAGAMFLTSMNLRASWEQNVVQAADDRKFDLELRLEAAAPADRLMRLIGSVSAVRRVEAWSITPAALAGDGGLSISRRYPDGGHGSFALRAAPADTILIARTMLAGRWLRPDETGAEMINSQALSTSFSGAKVGGVITLCGGHESRGTVNTVRIALSDRAQVPSAAAAVTAALSEAGIGVKATLTEKSFSAAQGAHIYILVWALGFIAVMMAVVGLLGLASSLGNSVSERTREFGVMRALGRPRALWYAACCTKDC